MFGKFIDSNSVTGTQIRLDNDQWLRGRNFANTGDLNILKVTSTDLIEFKTTPYVEGQGKLALYSDLTPIQNTVDYLLSEQNLMKDEIDALQAASETFALKNLSNLTSTFIPDGVGLNSVSTTLFSITTDDNAATSPTGEINIHSGDITNVASTASTGFMRISSGDNSGSGNSGNIDLYAGSVGSGIRGDIGLDGKTTTVKVQNYDVAGWDSLFIVRNTSPGSIGEIQFLSYAMGNDTMGMRIFNSDPSSGFSIEGYSRINQNGGAFNFISTGILADVDSTLTGGDFNITASSVTYIDPLLGLNASVSSGNVNISTENGYVSGSNTDANTGNIQLITGTPQGAGTRGNIGLNASFVEANIPSTGNFQITNSSGSARIEFAFADYGILNDSVAMRIWNSSPSNGFHIIGLGQNNQNGGRFFFESSFVLAATDGVYSGGDFDIATASTRNYYSSAANISVNSGNVNIITDDGYVNGSYLNANSGNIQLNTGNPQGTGSRGYISLNGDYITTNSKQIKNVADGTDLQDAVTVSQLGGISSIYALTDLSNLVPTAIPDGVNLESVSINQSATTSFSLRTKNQTTSVSGRILIRTGDTDSNFVSGSINIDTGACSNAIGATNTTILTGSLTFASGTILSGTRGSSGPSFLRSGNISNFTTATVYSGNTGIAGVQSGSIQSSFNGATINGNSGSVSLVSGNVQATVADSTANGNSGSVTVGSGNLQTLNVSASVTGNSGLLNMRSGAIFGSGFSTSNSGLVFVNSGDVVNVNNIGNTGNVYFSTGANLGTGNSGNVFISSGVSNISGNTGNINISTGLAVSGSRGVITLDASFVSANSTQIKNVADPTDPQDALTLNYFNNNIPSLAALDYYPLQAYNTYAPIYADGDAGVLDPVTPTNPRPGWYFINSAGSPQKINWYFFDGNIVSCELQNFAAFAVVTLDSIASLPYFIYYTFPTGSGDVIPGFAHSQVVYSAPYVPSAVVGTKYLVYFGAEPDVFPYLPRIELTYNAVASGGDQGATELVSTAAFSTESSATANQVQVMVENLGLNLSNFKAYFNLLIFPVFEESQDYYGSFYSSQSQTNPVEDIARAMTFNNTDEANGVSIVSNSQITFAKGGLYNVQFSAQFSNANGSKREVDIWLSKNGVNVPYTNSQEQISGQIDTISAWNFFIRVTDGQYVELYWSSPSTDISILYTAAKSAPDRPETPSIILTVNKIIS